jgi:hypothetical protein
MGLQQSRSPDSSASAGDYETPSISDTDRRALIPRLGMSPLLLMMEFIESHAALVVCRALSRTDKEAVDGRLEFIANHGVFDHVVLRVPGELLQRSNEAISRCKQTARKVLLRTHLGEEVELFDHPELLEYARDTCRKLHEMRGEVHQAQLDPFLQVEWLRSHETMKSIDVLEPLYKKLNVYEETFKVHIKELTISDPNNVMECHAVAEHVAKRLSELQHLRRVHCKTSTSSWFFNSMKRECSQLVAAGGFIDT